MRIEVYRNLTRGCWSIRDKRTRRVTGHAAYVELVNCRLRVSEAGRQRVLRTRRKGVHAWIEGDLVIPTGDGGAGLVAITYNPYQMATFQRRDTGAPVTTASRVILSMEGAYAVSPIQ
jgi:hypothetical protein